MGNRSRAATVGDRPGAGAGPGVGPPDARSTGEDGISKDDGIHVARKQTSRDGFKSYHMPIRGKLPTPDASPQRHTPPRAHVVRPSTPDSFDGKANLGFVAIGTALGSPSHPTGFEAEPWQPQLPQKIEATGGQADTSDEKLEKTKTRKWNFFGRSKSKRARDNGSSRQRSVTEPSASPPSQTIPSTTNARGPRPPAKDIRDPKTPRHKPIMIRSQTEPVMSDGTNFHETRTTLAPHGPEGRLQLHSTTQGYPISSGIGPMLNVEIPSIELERYSVMFGNLLKPQSTSSLLIRRQATLDRLKTIDAERTCKRLDLPLPPRRGTSPHTRNSPSFSLFPPTPGKTGTPQPLSARGRSNTSPALMQSPAQPSFGDTHQREETIQSIHITSSLQADKTKSTHRPTGANSELPPLTSKFHKQQSPSTLTTSPVYVDSPASMNETAVIHIKDKLLPTPDDAEWQMVSPPEPLAESRRSRKEVKPAPVIPEEHFAEKTAEEEEVERALREAVEVSIARQISVSQQQRKMLRPLEGDEGRSKKNGRSGRAASRLPRPIIAIGQNERLAETKTSTPTLVVPQREPTPARGMHMHRKSERVILEGD